MTAAFAFILTFWLWVAANQPSAGEKSYFYTVLYDSFWIYVKACTGILGVICYVLGKETEF